MEALGRSAGRRLACLSVVHGRLLSCDGGYSRALASPVLFVISRAKGIKSC